MAIPPDEKIRSQVADAVRTENITRIARALGVNRVTLASYVSSSCHSGSVLLIESRWRALAASPPTLDPVRA